MLYPVSYDLALVKPFLHFFFVFWPYFSGPSYNNCIPILKFGTVLSFSTIFS